MWEKPARWWHGYCGRENSAWLSYFNVNAVFGQGTFWASTANPIGRW